ncbi:transcriptional regulator [Chromatiales bacterium (ex Bugula neritina AB1)]|nr:transcriptional regulator [Chromatiales bacterium (ex Bugula neritina AB1)]
MLDELRQIAIFAKTVDHGSFRAAAQALQLSPSVVSSHVGQLEKRLGTALLYRSTRKLSLTPDGERLLESAHEMINAAESGLQQISNQTSQYSGVLRITMPALFTQSILIDHIAEFAREYPKVDLSLDFSEMRRDIIADGFDIAIRAGDMKDSSFKAQKIFEFARCLVASPAYLETQAKVKSPSDLNDWDWIALAPVRGKKVEFRKVRKRQSVQKMNSRISANSVHAVTRLARVGSGLAIVPEYIAAPHIVAGELEYVFPDWSIDPISVYAVWPSNAPRDGLTKQLVKFLKAKQ